MAKWDLSKLPEGRKPLPDAWFKERAQMQYRIKELEAKLAKAVDALGRIADDCEADYPPSHGAIKHDARTTLAELTGGKDE